MARFVAILNCEIRDILDYKEYTNMTRLFHFACKAKREVQGRNISTKTNFSIGGTNSWQRSNECTAPPSPSPSRVAPSTSNNNSKSRALPTNSVSQAPSAIKKPHRPLSLLHLQAERETYSVTGAKGLDVLCVTTLPSMFWSLKMMVSTLQLVISMKIHLLCLQLIMQVMTTTERSILVPVMQITMRA
jgi:hypothetical protein